MTERANPSFHDDYECDPGAMCVGELRHELLTDPTGDMLPVDILPTAKAGGLLAAMALA